MLSIFLSRPPQEPILTPVDSLRDFRVRCVPDRVASPDGGAGEARGDGGGQDGPARGRRRVRGVRDRPRYRFRIESPLLRIAVEVLDGLAVDLVDGAVARWWGSGGWQGRVPDILAQFGFDVLWWKSQVCAI